MKGKTKVRLRRLITVIVLFFGFLQIALGDSQDLTYGSSVGSMRDLQAPSGEVKPDFSGTWVLDHSASDDLRKMLKARSNDGPRLRQAGGAEGGFERGHAGAGGGFHRSTPDKGMAGDALPGDVSAETLTIVHDDPLLTITTDRSGERRLYTDFRGASVSVMGSRNQDVIVGGWEGEVLVIETTTAGGSHSVQRLQLLERPVRLERTLELPFREPDRKRRQVRQIFRPKGQVVDANGSSNDAVTDDFNLMED